MGCEDKISDSVQEKFMAAINNPISMPIAAAAGLLRPNKTLVRASARAATQRPGALFR
jgi:hypothetical protein